MIPIHVRRERVPWLLGVNRDGFRFGAPLSESARRFNNGAQVLEPAVGRRGAGEVEQALHRALDPRDLLEQLGQVVRGERGRPGRPHGRLQE